MVGFLISSRLEVTGYLGMASFFIIAHLIAFVSALLMKDVVYHEPEPEPTLLDGESKRKQFSLCVSSERKHRSSLQQKISERRFATLRKQVTHHEV